MIRSRIQTIALTVVLVFTGLPASIRAADERPNVLFISVDDMNDWVGCLGSDRVATPNIDALAERGLLFTDAHAASPKCAPSRAAILLGRRPSTTGLYSNGHWWRPAYPDAVTMPQYFKRHGYTVAGGGKVHHHTPGFNPPDQWTEYFDLVQDKDLIVDYFKERNEARRFLTDMPRHPSDSLDWGPMDVDDMDMGDARTVKWAAEFLQQRHDKPFFLAVGLFQPHLPFYAPKKYFDAMPLDSVSLPVNKPGDLDDIPPGGQEMAAYRRQDLRMVEEHDSLKHCVQSYLCSITHADTMVGKVMEAFDGSDYQQNTIVVLWSDHGYHFGEKDHLTKNTLWQRSTHVPFIVIAPGLTTAGTRCSHSVDLTCLYPTLTRLCGLPVPDGLDGADIGPLLKEPQTDWHIPAMIDFLPGNTAVCTSEWRYIRYREGGEELYDRHDDPHEWTNLAGKPDKQSVIGELSKWLPPKIVPETLTKQAYEFNEAAFTWKNKTTGTVTSGR